MHHCTLLKLGAHRVHVKTTFGTCKCGAKITHLHHKVLPKLYFSVTHKNAGLIRSTKIIDLIHADS